MRQSRSNLSVLTLLFVSCLLLAGSGCDETLYAEVPGLVGGWVGEVVSLLTTWALGECVPSGDAECCEESTPPLHSYEH